jgi:hypothetical protein
MRYNCIIVMPRLRREGREHKARGLALKGGKSPANPPGFLCIPAWYREMQIGS